MTDRPKRHQTFFAELKRRQVFKVAAVYGAVAFAVMQAADFLVPALRLPEAVATAIALVAILGFPLALVLAWAFDLTPEGVQRERSASSAELEAIVAQPRARRWPAGILALAGVVLLAGGGWWVLSREADLGGGGPAAVDRRSVAVLPFTNLSRDDENQPFTDGIHDDLLTQLSKISELKVISRTSVQEYRNTTKNLREIGMELGVAAVLEGGVQRAGDQVRINVQLIDASSDQHLWAETYNRTLSVANIFAIQSEIASAIATALRARLSPEERQRIEARPTDDLRAYDLYLRGKEYFNRPGWQETDFNSAQRLFEQAVEIDPDFAAAHAWLSIIHSRFYHFFYDRSDERLHAARAAAQRALTIDPQLAEAHLAQSYFHYWVYREFDAALAELAIAERGLPGDAELMKLRAYIYRRQGRWEEALTALQRAAVLDPRDSNMPLEIGETYAALHRYDEAERQFKRTLELAPDNYPAEIDLAQLALNRDGDPGPLRRVTRRIDPALSFMVFWGRFHGDLFARDYAAARETVASSPEDVLRTQWVHYPRPLLVGWIHQFDGSPATARAAFDSARKILEVELAEIPADYRLHEALGQALAGLGREDEAIRSGRRAIEMFPASKDAYLSPESQLALAYIYASVGEPDSAVARLEQYLSGPHIWSAKAIALDPRFDVLKNHPGFQGLIAGG